MGVASHGTLASPSPLATVPPTEKRKDSARPKAKAGKVASSDDSDSDNERDAKANNKRKAKAKDKTQKKSKDDAVVKKVPEAKKSKADEAEEEEATPNYDSEVDVSKMAKDVVK